MKYKRAFFLSTLLVAAGGLALGFIFKKEQTPKFVINEIQSANIDQFMDPSFNFGGWIELYNPEDETYSLSHLYISNDSTQLKKSKLVSEKRYLRPKDYAVYWFGYNIDTPSQINFNLDVDGGTLYISDEDGKILIEQEYPQAISRTSYARQTDGGKTWNYTDTPTLGSSNNQATYSSVRLEAPQIDTDSRLFTKPFDIQVAIPRGTQLYYTLDGTAPTLTNGLNHPTGDFHIKETTILRCRLFQKGKLPSPVITRSYIHETRKFDLPVLSVVTDSSYLYDENIGIFVKGVNGKAGNGSLTPCNWNMDWNRPTNIEYITTDGKTAVNQEANIRISGGWSRANNPKSFKIEAKKKFDGQDFLPYSAFPSKPYNKSKTWLFRNGGNDYDCRIKDAAMQEIVLSTGMDVEGQVCQPVVHYINGKFVGLINLREPNNKDYAYTNYGWKKDDIDQFSMTKFGYKQSQGTDEAFIKWYKLSEHADQSETYQQIRELVDIDEYINYMAVHLFLGCSDFAKKNLKGFRPRTEDGKFRFVLLDLDSALDEDDFLQAFSEKRFYAFWKKTPERYEVKEIKFVTTFFNMLKNEQFRKQFIDTYCLVAGSIFEQKRCEAIIDSMVNQRAMSLAYENKSSAMTGHQAKQQLRGRQDRMLSVLRNSKDLHLNHLEPTPLKLASNINCGNLLINNLAVPTNQFDGYVFLPVTLQANTPAGYRFVGWQKNAVKQKVIFASESQWKYYDGGSLDGKNWQTACTEKYWKESAAPFGYNDRKRNKGLNTILRFGNDRDQKIPTFYLHKDFQLDKSFKSTDRYVLNYTFNNGIIIYINGKELTRDKMRLTNVSYSTYATYLSRMKLSDFEYEIPKSMLHEGKNCIAVEMHNASSTTPFLYFSARLTALEKDKVSAPVFLSRNENFLIDEQADLKISDLIACFEPISHEERPKDLSPVVINEISAANSIYINEYFKKKDWIELYNTTDQVIDLDGMYISNKSKKPHKFQIVKKKGSYDTEIPPHGYKVIWADEKKSKHEIHTGFKLSKSGGEVILTASDDSWSNRCEYQAHSGKNSIARYPDGDRQFYMMTIPTIAFANRLNSYAVPVDQNGVNLDDDFGKNGHLDLVYEHDKLLISTPDFSSVMLTVKHCKGRCVLENYLIGGDHEIHLGMLAPGKYTARAVNSKGLERVVRFTVSSPN